MRRCLETAALIAALSPAPALATTYFFSVVCPGGQTVEAWIVGDIDPGREYLRVATGMNNPGCSISDASEIEKQTFPIKEIKGWEAAWKAMPFFGPLMWDLIWD